MVKLMIQMLNQKGIATLYWQAWFEN